MTRSLSERVPSKSGAILILALAAVAGLLCLRLRIDNRFDRMLVHKGEAARVYDEFIEEFGNDEFVIVALSGMPIFEIESLDAMIEGLELLEAVPHVEHVTGIASIFRDRFGAEDPEEMEEEIKSTSFYNGLFLSKDETIAGLLLQTDAMDTPASRRELVDGLFEAVVPLEEFGFRVDVVGAPVFNTALNRLSLGESLRVFPIAAFASLIALLLLLRSIRAAFVVIFCGFISLLLTMGLVALVDRPLNVVTSSLPLILWVLALANCIHIVCRYQYHLSQIHSIEEALGKALAETRFACTLSAVTTALGFFSLVVAEIQPIRELGILVAVGLIISLWVNLVLGPNLLRVLKVPVPRRSFNTNWKAFEILGEWVIRHPAPILVVFAVLIVSGVYSLQFIGTDSNSLTFMPQDSQIVTSYNFVGENLTGTGSLELMIETPGSWLNPDYWPAIERISENFSASEIVPRVVTPLGFLKKMNQWDHDLEPEYYVLPESREDAEALLDLLDEDDMEEINRLVSADGMRVRVSVLTKSTDTTEFRELIDIGEESLAELPSPMTGVITGTVSRMNAMSESLVSTQIRSFAMAFVMVFIAILIGLRSLRIMVVSIIPNVMPILVAFGVMAVLGIPLDAATVMVASIALGIAVDDTVHLLAGFRRERALDVPNRQAIVNAVKNVGPSMTVTTISGCIGFFTLSSSAFVPVSYFGFLSGIAMLAALAADLFLVPAMLAVTKIDSYPS